MESSIGGDFVGDHLLCLLQFLELRPDGLLMGFEKPKPVVGRIVFIGRAEKQVDILTDLLDRHMGRPQA